jgi:hypothetical protein
MLVDLTTPPRSAPDCQTHKTTNAEAKQFIERPLEDAKEKGREKNNSLEVDWKMRRTERTTESA